ncbi:hypothetical protein M2334_002133 [Sphingobium sp. B11D3D]|nr:hypothetical protein [Sphingobium sp. B11D3D]
MNVHSHASVQQAPNSGLNVNSVTPEPVHRVDMQGVSGPHALEHGSEAGTVCGHDAAAHALVCELLIEATAHCGALGFNRLVCGRDTIVSDPV